MITVLLILIAALAVGALFGVFAVRFGAESRPFFDEHSELGRFGSLR